MAKVNVLDTLTEGQTAVQRFSGFHEGKIAVTCDRGGYDPHYSITVQYGDCEPMRRGGADSVKLARSLTVERRAIRSDSGVWTLFYEWQVSA